MPVVKAIAKHATKPLDVHLMIENPERYVEDFVKAGADYLTVHVEACTHIHRVLQQIKATGAKAGVSLNPGTPLSSIEEVLGDVDLILIMSVNPGFGGQKFIRNVLPKVQEARALIDASGLDIRLEVDGGVTADNIAEIAAAGADTFVAGSAIYGKDDYKQAVDAMRKALA
jgi:ribulose-phosphate 3-epimerase